MPKGNSLSQPYQTGLNILGNYSMSGFIMAVTKAEH